MQKPVLNPEEKIFTLSDLQQLFRKQYRHLLKIALIGGLCAFAFASLCPVKYKIEATFKEGVEKSGESVGLRELLGGIGGGGQQPQAIALMKSFPILKPLVQKLGLQAEVARPRFLLTRVLGRVFDNIKTERGISLKDPDPFVFENVLFDGEVRKQLWLKFSDKDHFTLFDSDKKTELAQGSVGSVITIPTAQFCLCKTPAGLKCGSFYSLALNPLIPIAKGLKQQLQISPDKNNKSIYELKFLDRDRHHGVRLLNELMAEYQRYLKREHDELAVAQLAYLEKKQSQILTKLASAFDEHTAYLASNIHEKGIVGVLDQNTSLLASHQQLGNKLVLLDVELGTIGKIEKEGYPLSAASQNLDCCRGILPVVQELRQKRDLFELSLQNLASENDLEWRREELREIRKERAEMERALRDFQQGKEISFPFHVPLLEWANALRGPEEREDLVDYLENRARLLSLREKMLQDRFFCEKEDFAEFEGIDLETARALFVEYNKKLDFSEGQIRRYAQLKEQLHRPDFEISSLCVSLNDPLSQKLVMKASELSLSLKDEKNRSSKEGERWREELLWERKILSDHLDQLAAVESVNVSLVREKMVRLQKLSLDCINQQLSAIQERTRDLVKNRKEAILREKAVLEKKQEEIRLEASCLPEKWRMEKWLTLKSDMGLKFMGSITELVEAKTISHHLHHVESKPLECALLPGGPQSPKLFMMSLIGGFVFAFSSFFVSLVRGILKGFPLNLEKLQTLGFPLLGSISWMSDGPLVDIPTGSDLDLLRRVALFAEGAKVIGLIGGEGSDYSFALGENLARKSSRSIILRCDFLSKSHVEDLPGLLQVLNGDISPLPIRKGKGFDYISSGGYSPFGAELIQSKKFSQLVEDLRETYDFIFIFLKTPLSCAESMAALRLCDKAVVTILKEPIELLTPFIDWAYHEGNCRLRFVLQS